MNSLQGFAPALTHWCFGITILIGLISSGFTGAESVLAIFVAGSTSTLSTICSCATTSTEPDCPTKKRRLNNLLGFLIMWLDILGNLVASATCARLASATVDYISKGHFREFLFGLEQHSLGEPWPDVLGVTIILVVTVMFMLGLEKSTTISILLFLSLLGNFAFFTFIGSFHTVNDFKKWLDAFKVHSFRMVLKAASICSFAFVHKMPLTSKNNCLKIGTMFFLPWLFYTVLTIVFSLMTRYRELEGTAIPLIQVFQNRDVDWARPVMAVFTICVVCLLLTELMPSVYFSFVQLAGDEWKVFIGSIQYRSRMTGAPVLAIFAAGSLAAILAFACPLSHLIKLLNVSCLIKCVLTSCKLVCTRYRPDVMYSDLQAWATSNVQYSKLNKQKGGKTPRFKLNLKERLKGAFARPPQYVHKLSSPRGPATGGVRNVAKEERECLLLDDDCNKNMATMADDGSNSENEENEMEIMSCSDGEHSDSSTDIDVVVEEYREGLRVSAMGKFNEKKPSTKWTSAIVIMCLILIKVASISIALRVFHIIDFYWPDILAILSGTLIITGLPANASEKSKPCLLPSLLFPFCHSLAIVANTILAAMIVGAVWQGVVFWLLAGLILYWRCDCCQCDVLEPLVLRATAKVDPQTTFCDCEDDFSDRIIFAR